MTTLVEAVTLGTGTTEETVGTTTSGRTAGTVVIVTGGGDGKSSASATTTSGTSSPAGNGISDVSMITQSFNSVDFLLKTAVVAAQLR
jgi:hypothetical protein